MHSFRKKSFLKHIEEKTPVCPDEKTILLARYILPFSLFVASLALSRSRGKTNKPLFYLSLVDDYHGLSDRVEVRAAYNTALKRKAYNTRQKKELDLYFERTEEMGDEDWLLG